MENIDFYANAFAHDRLSLESIIVFYRISSENGDAYEILNRLIFLLAQSGPQTIIIKNCIESLPRKLKNSDAAGILKNNSINDASRKILNLSTNQYEKSFVVLLFIFKACDKWRQENICKGNCNHEWHNIKW
ncbi:DUF5958 family protein [Chryseobacterium sp.]|uniref:DUF5958 family protein n=1 Tax=Chryseobacterium sp. TaxID=1871047 RepID=UPI002FC6C7CD